MKTMFEDRFPVYHKKLACIKETKEKIIPYLEKLWDQHDALVPPWIATGGAFSTFPKHQGMDPNGKLLHQCDAMSQAIIEIMQGAEEYWKMLNLSPKYKPEIDIMWAQRYVVGKGDVHNHPEYVISGGLYLHAIGKQTITMETAALRLYNPELLDILENPKTDIELAEGDIWFWPGWMDHSIESQAPDNHDGSATRMTMPFMIKAVEL